MAARLDVRSAVREANDVFWRWPVRFCLPIVVCGTVSWASAEVQGSGRGGPFISLIVGLVSLPMAFVLQWATVSVSAMYLRARDGGKPTFEQLGEARRNPALWPTIWGLFGWYLLWGLGFGAVAAFPYYLWQRAVEQGDKPIVYAGYTVGVPLIVLSVGWLLSKYAFALPLVAIRKWSPESLASLSDREGREWRKPLTFLMSASIIPGMALAIVVKTFVQPHITMHGLQMAVEFFQSVLADCWSAWFVLVITQITLQRFAEPMAASEGETPFSSTPALPPLSGLSGLTG